MSAWRWSKEEATAWYEGKESSSSSSSSFYRQGVNFVPSSASNQFEMWMEPDWTLIQEELMWASFLNFNAVRVFLHDKMYANEGKLFWEKVDKFLNICQEFSIKVVLVLFDSYGDPMPQYGEQEEPIPYLYRSRWVQSPGRQILTNQTAQQVDLKEYVTACVRRYGNDDKRVLMIDLWNDPFQTNPLTYGNEGTRVPDAISMFGTELPPLQKQRIVQTLLPLTFQWARSIGSIRVPLTVGLSGSAADFHQHTGFRIAIEQSDIISFYNFENATSVIKQLDDLHQTTTGKGTGPTSHRPVVCTEYLARTHNSTVDPIAGDLYQKNVWGFVSGLVEGRTQRRYSPDTWNNVVPCSHTWYQDLLYPNGTAFSDNEAIYLHNFRFSPDESSEIGSEIQIIFNIFELIGWIWFYVAIILWLGFFICCWCYCCVLERASIQRTNRKAVEDQELSPFILSSESVTEKDGTLAGRDVAKVVFPRYPTLLSSLPFDREARPALAGIDDRSPISLHRIQTFVSSEFGPFLNRLGLTRNDRIAVALPDGPEFALAVFATANWASCVPLDVKQTPKELEDDIKRCDIKMIIGPSSLAPLPSIEDFKAGEFMDHVENPFRVDGSGIKKFGEVTTSNIRTIADKLNISYVGIVHSRDEAGLFRFVGKPKRVKADDDSSASMSTATGRMEQFLPTQHTDEALLIITKDKKGQKKLVPHTLGSILISCSLMSKVWKLKRRDVNCMVTPLLSSPGLIHQFFATLLSGGCAVCCPRVTPQQFLRLWNGGKFTWFYCEPVAHEALLKVVADSKKVASRPLSRTQKTSERLRRLQDMSSLATDKMTRKFRMVVTPTIGLSPSVLDALSKVYEVDVEMITTVPECVPVATARLSWKDQSSSNDGASKKKKKKVAAASTTLPSNLITGPELAIFDQANNTKQILKPGEIGSIFIRGSPCFQGYSYDHVIGSQFSLLPFRSTDWFDTDLVGCLEVDGRIRIVQEPGDAKEYNSS